MISHCRITHASLNGPPPRCSELFTDSKCTHWDVAKRFLRSGSASNAPHAVPLSIRSSTIADIAILRRGARAGEGGVASRIPLVVHQGLGMRLLATERMHRVCISIRGGEAGLFIVEVRRGGGHTPHRGGGDSTGGTGNERKWGTSNALHDVYFTVVLGDISVFMWAGDWGKSLVEGMTARRVYILVKVWAR